MWDTLSAKSLRLRHYIVLAANPGRSRSSGVLFFWKHPYTAAPSACHLHRGRGSDAHHPPKRRLSLPDQATYSPPCQLRCRARPRVPARHKLLRKTPVALRWLRERSGKAWHLPTCPKGSLPCAPQHSTACGFNMQRLRAWASCAATRSNRDLMLRESVTCLHSAS